MRDQYGRPLTDLRVSITDRCNLRCVYCMPEDGIAFRPPAELLQDDELVELIDIATELGVEKIRLTGGEPTVRPGIVSLVRRIAAIPGIKDLAMTTNAVLLEALDITTVRAPKNFCSARKSSIRNDVPKSGAKSDCKSSLRGS